MLLCKVPGSCVSCICIVSEGGEAVSFLCVFAVILKYSALVDLIGSESYQAIAVGIANGKGINDLLFPACKKRELFAGYLLSCEVPFFVFIALSGLIPTCEDITGTGYLIVSVGCGIENIRIGIVSVIYLTADLGRSYIKLSAVQLKGCYVLTLKVIHITAAP